MIRLTTRALSALLCYPSAELVAALPEIELTLLADRTIKAALPGLRGLLRHLSQSDLLDAQEAYVGLFDRTRSVSLHLFEHVHGDGRERGPAMAELAGVYAEAGLLPMASELPDFLPMLLEYASLQPEQGVAFLINAAPVLDLLHQRLEARDSHYAAVLHAVLLLAGQHPSCVRTEDEAPETPESLDAAWEEAAVLFGPGADPAAECGSDALAARLRAARRTPNPTPRRPVIRHLAASQG
jgi:nitrate reductase delta subunit